MKTALIKLHIAVFIWGFTGILGKFIELNEGLLVWYRVAITLITIFTWQLFIKAKFEIGKKNIRNLLFNGCIIALHWVFFYGSIKYSNVSIGLVCLSSISFFTAILEPIITKTKFSFISLLLSLLGVLGIFLIFHFENKYRSGILIGILSALFSSLFSCYNKKHSMIAKTEMIIFYQLLGGWLFLTIAMPFYLHYLPAQKLLPSKNDWFGLIMLSWICTIIAMWLSLEALKKVSAFTQNLTLNLEPVYGIALAFIFYNEQKDLNHTFYWGILLIFLSVVFQMIRLVKYKIT